jgi:hypothetical protein
LKLLAPLSPGRGAGGEGESIAITSGLTDRKSHETEAEKKSLVVNSAVAKLEVVESLQALHP